MYLTKYLTNPVDNFLSDFFDVTEKKSTFTPKANIKETKNGYEIAMDLPGVEKSDVTVNVKDGYLTVKGERKNEEKEEKDGYIRVESSYGSFARSWNVDEIDTKNIKAEHVNGILKLELPKKKEVLEKDEVKKIEIK